MQSPQLENGFTRIANELYEAIIGFPLTGYQLRVLHAIIRKTYGFGKKSDKISLSQLSQLTNIAKPHICRAIKELKSMNIVTTDGNSLGVNKNHELWLIVTTDGNDKPLPRMVMSVTTDGNTVTTDGNKSLPPAALQKKKETITKETIQKKEYAHLDDVGENDISEIAERYQVPIAFVRSVYEDMVLWAGSRPDNAKLKGRNWKLTLMKWVKKDAMERREHAEGNSRIAYVGEPITESP